METTYTLPAPDDADDLVRSAIDVAVCACSSDMSMTIYDLRDCIDTLLDALEKRR